jgi:hypothetical protein
MNRHQKVFEQLAEYTLGALDEKETTAVRAHLQSCAECQAEFSRLAKVAGQLAELSPRRKPPAELRSRILAAIEQDALPRRGSEDRRERIRFSWLWGALAVVFFFVQAWLLNEIIALRETLVEQQQIVAVMLSTDLEPVELQFQDPTSSADGSFRLERELNLGVLNYYQLALPEPGSYYHCWFEYGDARVLPCGKLPLDPEGHGILLVQIPVPIPDILRVTLETGALPTPSGLTVLEVDIPREP